MLTRSLLAVCIVGGCAQTTATQVTKENPNPAGFLVNASSTMIIRDSAGVRALTFPDPCTRYAVNFNAVFAKNKSTLTLNQNGTLGSVEVDLDSTEVPLKLLELADGVLERSAGFPAASGRTNTVASDLVLFDIECGEDGRPSLVHHKTIAAPIMSPVQPAISSPTPKDKGGTTDNNPQISG